MKFLITASDQATSARAGTLETAHGTVDTPIFMPVGTSATVKGIHLRDLKDDIQAGIILGNTYHLYLRPGIEIIEKAGGLHRFGGWPGPMLTDSGGYQVYSLNDIRKISEEGVEFRSHLDGSKHFFTPENVMDIQRIIGADIIMAFDECTPYPCEYNYARNSMEITHRWLGRCIKRFEETSGCYGYDQSLFPIAQGGTFSDLRKKSAEVIAASGLPGNAIGGLSVGEPAEIMYEMTELVCGILPKDKPRYLMGVGTPGNILESISNGIDMFDCVMPTRNGRNGWLFTKNGIINIRNEKWKDDFSPVDPEGCSFVDNLYSKAYLRHLFLSNEMLGGMIASQHNLAFYVWLMQEARRNIIAGSFGSWKHSMMKQVEQRI